MSADSADVRKVYRAMKPDASGRPTIGPTARTLGVRPHVDLPVHQGSVSPNSGGLSVAPDDPANLPRHRRPRSHGGTGLDPLWEMSTEVLPPDLIFRQDQPHYGLIEPNRMMMLEEYEAALASTADHWKPIP